jgi:hypothetical protein
MKFELIGLFSLLQLGSVFSQDFVRPRPNWHKMSDADRSKFVRTFNQLNSGERPTIFDQIAGKHPQNFDVIHNNARFFAWHRIYLVELEQELKRIDPSVSLPYWDWTVYYNNMSRDPIWRWLGKGGNPNRDNCVTDGRFSTFQSLYFDDPNQQGEAHCSTRETIIPDTFTARKEDIESQIIDIESPESFWTNMEGGPHAQVHIGIGADFSRRASANDPIFWLHHAFVDKIWYDRQQKHKDWANAYPQGPCDLPTYTQTCQDAFDTNQYGYNYTEDSFSWTATREAKTPTRQAEPFTPLSNNSTITDETYNKYATQYILKDILLPNNIGSKKVKSDCELLNLPATMPIKNIRMMHYDEAQIRKIERTAALSVDQHNRGCLL